VLQRGTKEQKRACCRIYMIGEVTREKSVLFSVMSMTLWLQAWYG